MNTHEVPIIRSCITWANRYGNLLERIERDELRREKIKQKRRIKRHIRNSHVKTRFHQLVNEHYASHCLGNESAKLLKDAARYIQKLDSLIKDAKHQRQKCRKEKQKKKADEITRLISRLSDMYGSMRKDRDHFLERTRTLNQSTANLNHRIRSSCGQRGRQWHQRQQQRR